MTYATVEQVQAEFKELRLKDVTPISTQDVARFLQESDALINSYLGTRYTTPVTGIASVAQLEIVTVDTANALQAYTITINGTVITFTSGGAPTLTTIRDGLIAAVNASSITEPVTASINAADKLEIVSDVPGLAFSIATGSDLTEVNFTPNLIGDEALDILRHIEIMLVCARVASILRVKVVLDDKMKQDVSNLDKRNHAIKLLKKYASGELILPGADLISSGAGISGHTNDLPFDATFQRGVAQW